MFSSDGHSIRVQVVDVQNSPLRPRQDPSVIFLPLTTVAILEGKLHLLSCHPLLCPVLPLAPTFVVHLFLKHRSNRPTNKTTISKVAIKGRCRGLGSRHSRRSAWPADRAAEEGKWVGILRERSVGRQLWRTEKFWGRLFDVRYRG